ncbi:MAG: substrate-binding domain-containing protein [Candidatus Andeanibacterium colombiense]|uniref:Substrate-binding domain-containing protein n=1 Tax=Candidatus Andeanibacterium colombiense TaxID=3121345 RepID=A0AAJ5X9K5_9SPHN|nr:MAG: substrate-binding domain-containing protein [Sphingomonadaceae bacterium]
MKTKALLALPLIAATLSLAGCGGGGQETRDSIRAVGSSTVLPFAKLVSETFAADNSGFKAPIIEGNGTGGGMKLFCAGVGAQHPDIADASRRMKKSEYQDCAANGVTEIVEIQVGIDGIAFANAKSGPAMALTPVDIYKAIAANPFGKPNTAKTWHDVNPALPDLPIMVYGPATISGTRDALKELVLTKGCDSDAATKALADSDKDRHDKICGDLRTDGAYADTADNYNLIVQKLEANDKAVGIFGYSYLEENADKLRGLTINGVLPTYDAIADGSYPGARPLYIYVKKAHIGAVPGLQEFVSTWPKLWSKDGPLAKAGMIAMPDALQADQAKVVGSLTLLDPAALK